ncbi:MAG: 16S rRNA (guanine(527)-N(7))-methyltransferase RsmG [Gammaproteobacteria bacterium]
MPEQPDAAQLQSGLDELGISASAERVQQYLHYIALLRKWNRTYNLTTIRPADMIPLHILDSLTLLPFIKGERCLDVGSGAGLPGLILALNNPQQHWHLLDSNGKKTRFLRQAVTELQLTNVQIVQSRVEDYVPQQPFATIVCRAYATLDVYLQSVSHLFAANQTILAMKSTLAAEELQVLQQMRLPYRIQQLTIPGIAATRNLLLIEPDRRA